MELNRVIIEILVVVYFMFNLLPASMCGESFPETSVMRDSGIIISESRHEDVPGFVR